MRMKMVFEKVFGSGVDSDSAAILDDVDDSATLDVGVDVDDSAILDIGVEENEGYSAILDIGVEEEDEGHMGGMGNNVRFVVKEEMMTKGDDGGVFGFESMGRVVVVEEEEEMNKTKNDDRVFGIEEKEEEMIRKKGNLDYNTSSSSSSSSANHVTDFSAPFRFLKTTFWQFLAGEISASQGADIFNCVTAFVRMLEAILPYLSTLLSMILSLFTRNPVPQQQQQNTSVPTHRLATPPNQLSIAFRLTGVTHLELVSFCLTPNNQIFLKSLTPNFDSIETIEDLPAGDYSSASIIPFFDPKSGILVLTITGFTI